MKQQITQLQLTLPLPLRNQREPVWTRNLFGVADIGRQSTTTRGSWGVAGRLRSSVWSCVARRAWQSRNMYYFTFGRTRISRQTTQDTHTHGCSIKRHLTVLVPSTLRRIFVYVPLTTWRFYKASETHMWVRIVKTVRQYQHKCLVQTTLSLLLILVTTWSIRYWLSPNLT